ncbi:hypothetical protein HYPBUDRAFT_109194 [Hyphopichia burtonii NRRL Y-1933]|uniref:Uncharacterized protein n=1 Tax=Hyphopichia burtonii NRRL Y-1933 TaxID=984485 RepID=A0A1E4RI60_9ASCO|nr:hypothetical protein HYPBUDRAFT_109194 [Hyphopichia burtonii NRRL Y-1933]ODV66916.1 hypothetical protein HYPBUDRAFT_109194 [Hyphopichia burtonii NRRL Y-1933]
MDRNNQGVCDSSLLSYQEQLRRQKILNSIENKDYLLIIASQQNKSVQQVKYELMVKLTEN